MTTRNGLRPVSDELLAGTRVLELSASVAGAYCGRMLRLMGAEVSRWEAPTSADCPPALQALLEESLHEGKSPASYDDLGDLGHFDVVVTDVLHDDAYDGEWRRRAHEILAGLPEDVPVVDISGFAHQIHTRASGSLDPDEADEAGASTNLIACAVSGTSWGIGHVGQEPLALPHDLADYLTGAEAAGAASLALLLSATGHPGRYWDLSSADVLASYTGQVCSVFVPFGRPWRRDGARASQSGGFYPGAMFRCRDGQVTVVCRTDREWVGLRHAMGDPAWSREERFADARVVARDHADEADRYLIAWVAEHTCDEMMALGREHGFAVAAVLTPAVGARLDQFAHHGFIEDDSTGRPTRPGRPWWVSEREEAAGDGEPTPLELRPTPQRPLAGLKVLDLSWVWSGPLLTAQLADLGAEVIKVESRSRPDPTRSRGRALRDGRPIDGPDLEVSTYFTQMNRGKRSVTLNIATEEGAEIVRELARSADVVVENMRPGALERRGLGYRELSALNPDLVMLSMSMMGQDGPMRDLGGYAPVMSGLAGLDSLVGYAEDDLIGLFNSSLGDPNGAAHATAVLLAALTRRTRTGHGCWIDLSQIACMMATIRTALLEEVHTGARRVPGNGHARFWPHGVFRCAGEDEWLAVVARTPAERERLGAVIGRELRDPEQAREAVAAWAAGRDPELAVSALREAALPAARVDDFDRLAAAEWVKSRRLTSTLEHPYVGAQSVFLLPWKADGVAFSAGRAAPLLGSSTDAVLGERAGISPERLAALRVSGVIE